LKGISTTLKATIDRNSVATNKEIEEITGPKFTPEELAKRLENQLYLRPKHVEVIQDFNPVVEDMVEKIVSFLPIVFRFC